MDDALPGESRIEGPDTQPVKVDGRDVGPGTVTPAQLRVMASAMEASENAAG